MCDWPGAFSGGANTLVQAVTELGGGYWVLTPMRTDRGFVVLVNRGFIPQERKAEFERESGGFASPAVIDGLLRISEPGGGFLRNNDAARQSLVFARRRRHRHRARPDGCRALFRRCGGIRPTGRVAA